MYLHKRIFKSVFSLSFIFLLVPHPFKLMSVIDTLYSADTYEIQYIFRIHKTRCAV